MEIGYACLTLGVQNADFRTCLMKNADDAKLKELIAHNLNSLENIIDYNIENRIRLFRITSGLIPFGASPMNKLPWCELFQPQFARIGDKLNAGKIRVSMHAGHYTVLNSPDQSVAFSAASDLNYHTRVLDSLGTNAESKIILHIGGIYQDKNLALKRFKENYELLDDRIKQRLVIENDDRSYHIEDVLELSVKLNIPVVFDNLHHQINSIGMKENINWIGECAKTWRAKDGRQKIHYSQQSPQKRQGSHSVTVYTDEFMEFYESLNTKELDIMLEVKDKNLSAVKCRNLISEAKVIKDLELEWSRYKYAVLERSPEGYNEIRKLLKDKKGYPVKAFYQIIEKALKQEYQTGHSINAAQHMWGYFRDKATEQEKSSFRKIIEEHGKGTSNPLKLKRFLWRMTEKYQEPYLLDSYYFIFTQ